jgi:hypothetical protein
MPLHICFTFHPAEIGLDISSQFPLQLFVFHFGLDISSLCSFFFFFSLDKSVDEHFAYISLHMMISHSFAPRYSRLKLLREHHKAVAASGPAGAGGLHANLSALCVVTTNRFACLCTLYVSRHRFFLRCSTQFAVCLLTHAEHSLDTTCFSAYHYQRMFSAASNFRFTIVTRTVVWLL